MSMTTNATVHHWKRHQTSERGLKNGYTVTQWYESNALLENKDNFKIMTLPECIEEIQTNIDGKNILPSVELKLRGLEIDNELNFTSHIQSICKKATCGSKIAVLSRFKNVIPINAKLHIYMRMNVRMKSRG